MRKYLNSTEVKVLLYEQGKTQRRAAVELGCSPGTFKQYLAGYIRVAPELARDLAEYLNTTVEAITSDVPLL